MTHSSRLSLTSEQGQRLALAELDENFYRPFLEVIILRDANLSSAADT